MRWLLLEEKIDCRSCQRSKRCKFAREEATDTKERETETETETDRRQRHRDRDKDRDRDRDRERRNEALMFTAIYSNRMLTGCRFWLVTATTSADRRYHESSGDDDDTR